MQTDNQGLASVVNRALVLENKLRQVEQDKLLLIDVFNEADRFCKKADDTGYHLTALRNSIERARNLVK